MIIIYPQEMTFALIIDFLPYAVARSAMRRFTISRYQAGSPFPLASPAPHALHSFIALLLGSSKTRNDETKRNGKGSIVHKLQSVRSN